LERSLTRAERIRSFPKTGWRNLLARHVGALRQRPAATDFLGYQTKTPLRLPFAGEWYVYWGGRTVAQNKHAVVRDQRFAYDLIVLAEGRRGQSFRSLGETNDDYYCFGLPIFAPADGVVVKAQNEVPDNSPGEMNSKRILGNFVIVDHGNQEFSFLAHFQSGSVVVRTGDYAYSGQLLGRCGNSGRSSEPHLHYHLQNTPDPFRGDGLPIFFVDYIANGKPISRGEPVARQAVRSQHEFGIQ
jgi:hypothetical protein